MKEIDFLNIINETLSDSHFLGDDCAYLEDLGIFVTQDSLIEDVHFSLKTTSPYKLGKKAVAVNLSDLAASLSLPKYISISISMPNSTTNEFIQEFYKGINDICNEYGVKVIGGDITGSEKIFISITAIGKKSSEYITSRKFAKEDELIVTTGTHGSSACALYCLKNNIAISDKLIDSHINPKPKLEEAKKLAKVINNNIALMDSSDGIVDALYKIAKASDVSLDVDFNAISISPEIIQIANKHNKDYKNWTLWGGEDYELIICLSEKTYKKLDKDRFKVIGKVNPKNNDYQVKIKIDDKDIKITKEIFENKSFNHFEEKK